MTEANSKPIWKSKTFWTGLVAAIAPMFPPLQVWMMANPEAYNAILGGVFVLLRLVSSDKVSVK